MKHTLSIEYGEDLLFALNLSAEELEFQAKLLLAAKLFELGKLSSGQAAKLCGMSRLRFIDELGRMGVPILDLDPDQIEEELRNA